MNKIIVTVGISGSGKSTWAKQYTLNNADSVIVSRDSIRMSLFGFIPETYSQYYEVGEKTLKTREDIVTKFCDDQIWYALNNGFDVVADNTHLRKEYINHYKQFGAFIDIKVFDVEEELCISRVKMRSKFVGSSVINKQFKNFQKLKNSDYREEIGQFNASLTDIIETCKREENDPCKKDCIVVDIDGTLALTGDRDIFDFSKVDVDSLNPSVATLCDFICSDGFTRIIICTGRDESCKKKTESWLSENDIGYEKIYMRKKNDFRKDWIVKAEFWKKIQKEYNILFMVDDRRQVVDFARKLGFDVFQVAKGDF